MGRVGEQWDISLFYDTSYLLALHRSCRLTAVRCGKGVGKERHEGRGSEKGTCRFSRLQLTIEGRRAKACASLSFFFFSLFPFFRCPFSFGPTETFLSKPDFGPVACTM